MTSPRIQDAEGRELSVGDRVRDTFFEDCADVVGVAPAQSVPNVLVVELFIDEVGPRPHFVSALTGRATHLARIDQDDKGGGEQ